MAGPRPEKVAAVAEVREHLERTDAAILTEYRGLKVGDLAALRRALRAAGAEYKIYKNTLVRRATAEANRSAIDPLLEGPTAIAFVEGDVAAVAKVLRDFARTNPALVVKGSFVGRDLLDARTTTALADLPSRDVMLAQIAGALAAPLRQFAGLLKALPQNLAYGLSALADQKRAAGDTSEAAAAPAAEASDAEAAEAGDTSEAAAAPAAEASDAEAADAESAPAASDETAAGADTAAATADETGTDETGTAETGTDEPAPDEPAADEPAPEAE